MVFSNDSLVITKYFTGKDQDIALRLMDRRQEAQELHIKMYNAFAK